MLVGWLHGNLFTNFYVYRSVCYMEFLKKNSMYVSRLVCLCVCLCVCLSVALFSVHGISSVSVGGSLIFDR